MHLTIESSKQEIIAKDLHKIIEYKFFTPYELSITLSTLLSHCQQLRVIIDAIISKTKYSLIKHKLAFKCPK